MITPWRHLAKRRIYEQFARISKALAAPARLELLDLLSGFELMKVRDVVQRKPGAWHWEFVAERLG